MTWYCMTGALIALIGGFFLGKYRPDLIETTWGKMLVAVAGWFK